MKQNVRKKSGKWKRRFTRFLVVWLLFLLLVACSRFAAPQHRLLDLLAGVSGFVVPLAILTLVPLVIRGRWVLALWAISTAAVAYQPIHLAALASFRNPAPGGAAAMVPTPYSVKILIANTQGSETALDELAKLIRRHDPDLVAIIEAGQETGRTFLDRPEIRGVFQFLVPPDRSILYSITLLSKYPLHRLSFADHAATVDESLYAFHHSYSVELFQGKFIFTAAHPPSPRSNTSWERGNEKTEALAKFARRELLAMGLPVIIAGDFNAPRVGYRQAIMKKSSKLVPSDELVAGAFTGTWPAHFPASFRLTLDRLWVSRGDVKIVAREVLREIGSDHRPVLFVCDFEPEF